MLDGFTLCQNNNFVQGELKDLKKNINKANIFLLDKNNMINTINKCLADLKIMKKQGQSLENRLKKYRKAVELLGYERKYK